MGTTRIPWPPTVVWEVTPWLEMRSGLVVKMGCGLDQTLHVNVSIGMWGDYLFTKLKTKLQYIYVYISVVTELGCCGAGVCIPKVIWLKHRQLPTSQCHSKPYCLCILMNACLYLSLSSAVVDCGPPPSPKDGSVSTPDGTTFNRDAWFSCNDGFELVGPESTRCLADRRWSPEPPTCRRTYFVVPMHNVQFYVPLHR